MTVQQLLTATAYTAPEDLIRHLDAQTDRAFTLSDAAAVQATRQLREPADFQALTLTARGQVADIAVLIESLVTAAQAHDLDDLANRLDDAAEVANDLLTYLNRAAHGTLPAADEGADEGQEDGDQDQADEPVAA
ncbi:hypothetical protein [Streptomyces sp. CT34]|uniref:hypothetical protein n=1 Tax=Streptomyces sp. CT34 TaxID=1553907 RepID=UPI0005BD77C6|nr:hypothetical protein [Streptomyces sp. CT34]